MSFTCKNCNNEIDDDSKEIEICFYEGKKKEIRHYTSFCLKCFTLLAGKDFIKQFEITKTKRIE